MTGAELQTLRRKSALTQTQLAKAAGIGRHAVSYWETKAKVDPNAWAVKRIGRVLVLPHFQRPPLRRFTSDTMGDCMSLTDAALIALADRLENQAARLRVTCGAKTRKGTPCRCKSEPGKRLCKFHGGMSTGAKTPEGRARIAEAQRRRWATWRAERDGAEINPPHGMG